MSYPSIDYFRTITSPSWPSVISSSTPLELGHQLFREHHGPQPSRLSKRLARLRKRLSASRAFGHWKNGKAGNHQFPPHLLPLEERLYALVFEEEMWLKAQPAQPAQSIGEVGTEVKAEKTWRGLELAKSLSLERILTWRSE